MKKCFAKQLCNCSKKISREHFISKSVLDLIEDKEKGILVSGLPWIETGSNKKVFSSSLVGKMLCCNHNKALSPLDAEALKILRFLRPVTEKLNAYINGNKLEKWILKAAVGILASENYDTERLSGNIAPDIVELLYSNSKLTKPHGLYILLPKTEIVSELEYSIEFITHGEKLAQVHFKAFGIHFILNLLGYDEINTDLKIYFEGVTYRPKKIIIKSLNGMDTGLNIEWDYPGEGVIVLKEITKGLT